MNNKNVSFIITYGGSSDCPSVKNRLVDYTKLQKSTIDTIESHETSYTNVEVAYTMDWGFENDLDNLDELPKGSVIDEFIIVTLDG